MSDEATVLLDALLQGRVPDSLESAGTVHPERDSRARSGARSVYESDSVGPLARGRAPKAGGPASGGVAARSSFLRSKQGKQLQNQVVRGVFGLLKKNL